MKETGFWYFALICSPRRDVQASQCNVNKDPHTHYSFQIRRSKSAEEWERKTEENINGSIKDLSIVVLNFSFVNDEQKSGFVYITLSFL
jgi:hypothetical protein